MQPHTLGEEKSGLSPDGGLCVLYCAYFGSKLAGREKQGGGDRTKKKKRQLEDVAAVVDVGFVVVVVVVGGWGRREEGSWVCAGHVWVLGL